jgi:hypothetical protein
MGGLPIEQSLEELHLQFHITAAAEKGHEAVRFYFLLNPLSFCFSPNIAPSSQGSMAVALLPFFLHPPLPPCVLHRFPYYHILFLRLFVHPDVCTYTTHEACIQQMLTWKSWLVRYMSDSTPCCARRNSS